MVKSKLDFKQIEEKWMKFWEKEKIYRFDANSKKDIFSIDSPPPTVSGKMHMGHAFGNSQQDFIARFKRMRGFNVLQPFGTDDNGLPTKLLIEKIKNVRASDMSREEFVKLVLKTLKEELRPEYIVDWKRLGISCDFDVCYTTIDEHCQRISQKSFIDLYKSGRQYRSEAATMFCPQCNTAISQVECEDAEFDSFFNDILFKVGRKDLVVATTRPELLPACVAIFYSPGDKRYEKFKGKKAKVPLFDFEVEIMPDERVDSKKGTGIVMCCTFGGQTDMEWQKTYNLEIKEAISREGKMTSLAGKYEGMEIKDARKKIIEDLKKSGLLKNQKKIKHIVNVHERCGTEIEFIHSKQWFLKYLDLKPKMLKWGKELNWFPKHMKYRYDNWVKGLAWDWCVSRQLPYGIPFPVWYCKKCDEVILADEKDLPVDPMVSKPPINKCSKCGCQEFVAETDIFNTWATSSLTPTIVKELFKGKSVYKKLINNPMNFRPQGHDIITFWLFNTVIKSHLHFDMKPWNDCFINGWMLDPKGKKMSKSKGNIIAPQDMIKKYSADALRYMAASSKLGMDLPFQEKELIAGTKMINKILNASKFVFMNLEDWDRKKPKKLEKIDKLFLKELNKIILDATENFEKYNYSGAKLVVENFFWKDFCDNYLEIVKKRIYEGKGEKKKSAQYTLYKSLFILLKMFAPFVPFITEEIYQNYFKNKEKEKSVHVCEWPKFSASASHNVQFEENIWRVFVDVLRNVRQEKTKAQKSMNSEIILTLDKKDAKNILEEMEEDLKNVTNARELKEGKFNVEF